MIKIVAKLMPRLLRRLGKIKRFIALSEKVLSVQIKRVTALLVLIEKIIFVRTVKNNDGWFSLGFWGGRLDIDGSLNAILNAE